MWESYRDRYYRWVSERCRLLEECSVPEVGIGLVCLHGFRGQEQEHPDTTCHASAITPQFGIFVAYLDPMTAVLPLIMYFSNIRYRPPGNRPKASVLSVWARSGTDVWVLTPSEQ